MLPPLPTLTYNNPFYSLSRVMRSQQERCHDFQEFGLSLVVSIIGAVLIASPAQARFGGGGGWHGSGVGMVVVGMVVVGVEVLAL